MSSTTASDRPADTAGDIIDRLSLQQALLDVEVANARVIDLTERLTASNAELRALRAQFTMSAQPPVAGSGFTASLRRLVAGPIKAAARAVLPLDVRIRLRAMLR